jgi:hypothetical protein
MFLAPSLGIFLQREWIGFGVHWSCQPVTVRTCFQIDLLLLLSCLYFPNPRHHLFLPFFFFFFVCVCVCVFRSLLYDVCVCVFRSLLYDSKWSLGFSGLCLCFSDLVFTF